MKIIGTTKSTTPCLWVFAQGIKGLEKYLDCKVILYDQSLFPYNIPSTNEDLIFICEAGLPIHSNFPLEQAKKIWPNSRIIIWGTDTIFWRQKGLHQVNLSLVDLYLEEHEVIINEYRDLGITCDFFDWNISDELINYINKTNIQEEKIYDFIGVYHPYSLTPDKYRGRMISFLQQNGYSFTQGGGGSHDDNDISRLLKHYRQSRICLGTSSHSTSNECKFRKGFRDFIAPFCNIPIIYDNYYEVINTWRDIMPYYECGNFNSIIDITQNLYSNSELYNNYINKQKEYAINNSIDKQLFNLIKKYNLK